MRLIEDLFEMGGGYVLDFSNDTFADFFQDELRIDIYSPSYAGDGTSKAKRLRRFLRTADAVTCARTLTLLWEYRKAYLRRKRLQDPFPDAERDFHLVIQRLTGKPAAPPQGAPAPQAAVVGIDPAVTGRLKGELLSLSQLQPQPRGYAFERFLKNLFDANGLSGRAAFRLTGEQIDGSFELSGETYLLEAKWTGAMIGASDLRAFNAKVEDKAAWSRGLFISESGFTEDGLTAFGRGKRVVCMDGLDLYEMLDRSIPFGDIMKRKVRRAAETGLAFVRVRDLYH
jgi:hypothetical protein